MRLVGVGLVGMTVGVERRRVGSYEGVQRQGDNGGDVA